MMLSLNLLSALLLLSSPPVGPAPLLPSNDITIHLADSLAFQAEPFEPAILRTKQGAMMYWNGPRHSFSVALNGDVQTTEEPNFAQVNGQLVQASAIAFQQPLDFTNLSLAAQKGNLEGYRDYELRYLKEDLKISYSNLHSKYLFIGDRLFLLWRIDMPKSMEGIRQQLFLTTICFDHILNLNAPISRQNEHAEAAEKLLHNIGASLQLSDHPADLPALFEHYQQEMKP